MVEPPVLLGGDQVSVVFPLVAVSWKLAGEPGWLDSTVRVLVVGLLGDPLLSVTVKVMV